MYAETVEPVVPLIFQRTKATCFAYGQTGKYFVECKFVNVPPDCKKLPAIQKIFRIKSSNIS